MRHLSHVQVSNFGRLVLILRKLKIIGSLGYEIDSIGITDFGRPIRYKIIITSYNPNNKGNLIAEELLTEYFITSDELNACIRQTE